MSVSALIAEGHVHQPPVCVCHLARSKGALLACHDTTTLYSQLQQSPQASFIVLCVELEARLGGGTGHRQFSLTCPADVGLLYFLGL